MMFLLIGKNRGTYGVEAICAMLLIGSTYYELKALQADPSGR